VCKLKGGFKTQIRRKKKLKRNLQTETKNELKEIKMKLKAMKSNEKRSEIG
jgi:hypothetical protein